MSCVARSALVLVALAAATATGRATPTSSTCAAGQLRVRYQYAYPLMGSVYIAVAYRNLGPRPCALGGWPHVAGIRSDGRVVRALRTGMRSMFQPLLRDESRRPGAPKVVLRHGESAYSFLAAAAIRADSTAPCPRYERLRLALPGSGRSVTLSGWVAGNLDDWIPACGRLWASQVLPRSTIVARVYGGS